MKHYFLLVALIFAFASQAEGAWVVKNGKLMNKKEAATLPVEQHFGIGMGALEKKDWAEAAAQFLIVSTNFPATPFGQDANYYLGIAYYRLGELEFANDAFSQYLKVKSNPEFFQEAIDYKFRIAEAFKSGERRRILGYQKLPKWASGKALAVKIYDEVSAALPCHDLAARALYSKANLLWDNREYRESVDSFQAVIKRFPKHELAPECFLRINEVFYDQCRYEFQNPDILAFAEINLKRFKQEFPREERIAEAENCVLHIKEVYAKGLYDIGQFYENTDRAPAAMIYYSKAIHDFPDTQIAKSCEDRLNAYQKKAKPQNKESIAQ